jgi:formylglycine-generating enzyme required for sulfatase activity
LKASAAIKRPKELVIDLDKGVKMEFVLIPAGSFLMGSQKGPKDEGPVHRVVISKPFYMAKFPVTQAQWQAVMGKPGRLKELEGLWDKNPDAIGPSKVMVGLSWNDCRDFARKLKAKTPDHAFALPSEAQWEYACRAGADSEFSFGDDEKLLGEYAWFEGNMIWPGIRGNTSRTAYPTVGQKKPNRWELYDLHGGVWEWCADWYPFIRRPTVPSRDSLASVILSNVA